MKLSAAGSHKKKVRLSFEERYASLLAVAREVFIEKGYEDVSMAEVASRAGVTGGNIYRYFSNRRELLLKVLEDWMEGVLADCEERLAGIGGVQNRLHFMIWHHLLQVKNNLELSNLLVFYVRSSPDYEDTRCFELTRKYTRLTESILEEGVAEGIFREDAPVGMVRNLIHGGSEYYAWSYIAGRSTQLDIVQAANQITDLIYSAVAICDESRPSRDVLERLCRLADHLEQGDS